jgi:O-antigen/teichoic acid export membrane protein
MQNLITFFKGFIDRKGNYVFVATVVARILSFLAAYIAKKLIDDIDLGYVLYAISIMAFIIPLSGFGVQQSLLRFGARLKSVSEKKALFSHVFKKGLLFSFILGLVIFLSSTLLTYKLPQAAYFLRLLSVLLISSFLLEIIKVQFRLEHNNKQFAYVEMFYNTVLVLSVFVLSYFFKDLGYAIAILTAPLLTFIWFFNRLKIRFKAVVAPIKIDMPFFKYGFFAGLANVATQLLFAVDILLIGIILSDAGLITAYKYVSLIPFSLLFLPGIMLTTDFVNLTERIYDKEYIKNYSKNYMMLFLLFSVVISLLFYPLSDFILGIFDVSYPQYNTTFLVLTCGVFGILIFRGLYGNLLSALGKANVNYWISFSALLINIPANYYLIPKYGILGAAITSASLMWFSSLSTWIIFKILHNRALK